MHLRETDIAWATVCVVVGLCATPAFAAPKSPDAKQRCIARGFQWSDAQGCADLNCTHNGKTYGPGDTRRGPPVLGMKRVTYYCDGFTGRWRILGMKRLTPST